MTITAGQPRVAVEIKADAKLLDKLFAEIVACQTATAPIVHTEHNKCRAIAELQARLFLGVAAGETWRLFTVIEHDGRTVLGNELADLNDLHF
jgi:hypothetical protein